jgi:hypothetical protein
MPGNSAIVGQLGKPMPLTLDPGFRGARLRLCVRASARTGVRTSADEPPRIPRKTASAGGPTGCAPVANRRSRAGKVERLPNHHPFPARGRGFLCVLICKSNRANIEDDEVEQFKAAAKYVMALTQKQLAELLEKDDFVEVKSE